MHQTPILRIAVNTPLRRLFDYLPPRHANLQQLTAGVRVQIPFGRQNTVGLLVEIAKQTDVPANKLKHAIAILDETPLFPREHLSWLQWIADYYQHPPGESLFSAIPVLLRNANTSKAKEIDYWKALSVSPEQTEQLFGKAPKQGALLALLLKHPQGVNAEFLNETFENWRQPVKALIEKGYVQKWQKPFLTEISAILAQPKLLNDEQQTAVSTVQNAGDKFAAFLLQGVTGSGKTEVYLSIIEHKLSQGKQALVLIPEIGLTPQFIQRFKERFPLPLAILHSGMNDSERLAAWLAARDGEARIVIGTRSALFTPFQNLGVIIIDEEHDSSYKQQDGLRYSARDMSVIRAQRENIPVILGSATPALETLLNAQKNRYHTLRLDKRTGTATLPKIDIIDIRGQKLQESISTPLLHYIQQALNKKEQVLLFLNRRGYSPTILCHDCGWTAHCQRCEKHMTVHRQSRRLRCHFCGAERPLPHQCPECSNLDLVPLGFGTERVEQFLNERFPDTEVLRIDRDTTRRKNSMNDLLERIHEGKSQILLGTQMLAKGHDFPNVTVVGILNADQGLYSTDMRATEHLAQLVTQVAGRAGRGKKTGRVFLQTHHADHPLLHILIRSGYEAFAQAALTERQEAHLPPYRYAALLRAEALEANKAYQFLNQARELIKQNSREVDALGPAPSPLEKKAGRYRMQLLLLATHRKALHDSLKTVLPQLEKERKTRWSIDIDPVDMS